MSERPSFLQVLARHAEQTPDAPALSDPSGAVSYAELWAVIGRVAGWLRERGVAPGDRVAIVLPGSVANLVLMFAAMAAGAVAAPVNTSLRRGESGEYLRRISPRLAVVGPEYADRVDPEALGPQGAVWSLAPSAPGPLGRFEGLGNDSVEAVGPDLDGFEPRAPAIMFGTGGTTGTPKAAMWSHEALWLYGASCSAAMEVRRDDVELFFSPQFHIALVTGPFGTLFSGGLVHLLPEFDSAEVAALLGRGEITRMFGAPTALARIIASPGFDPSSTGRVRRVLFGSTRSEPDLPARLGRAFPNAEFITGYGATEYGAVIRLRSWEERPGIDLGVGLAVPGVSVLIVGPEDEILPVGQVGELVIRAPWQMLGYWGQSPEAAAAFVHGGVRSGDLGERDARGAVHLRGRSKDVVITGGENVFPVEVEDVLSAHPDVLEVAVFGVLDREWGERVEAAVVLSAGAAGIERLGPYCRERLAGYKVPKRIHVVDALPLTSAMKVDKRALREVFGDA